MESLRVNRLVCARIPTNLGEFQLCLFENNHDDKEHLALLLGDVKDREDVLVRVHSECFTGDVLGSERCDCGEQLNMAIQMIAREGAGAIIYLRQEGRGIGLLDKLRAYNLQDQGYDTVDANLLLGHHPDERDYSIAARILDDLEVVSVRLLTNNPVKINKLKSMGIRVRDRILLEPTVTPENARYLVTKVNRMKHMMNLEALAVDILDPSNGSA